MILPGNKILCHLKSVSGIRIFLKGKWIAAYGYETFRGLHAYIKLEQIVESNNYNEVALLCATKPLCNNFY